MRLDGDDRAHELPREQPLRNAISYIVRVHFEAREDVEAYLPWLKRHVLDVIDAGAHRGEVVVIDDVPAVEARYVFLSRDAFERYEKEQAPRLRAEGRAELERLGLEPTFTRTTGEFAIIEGSRPV